MSDKEAIFQQIRKSPGLRLAVFFGSFFFLLLISSGISTFISEDKGISLRDRQLWMSVIQNILAFCLPAIILARFASNRPLVWLKLNKNPGIKPFIGVILIYLITMPAMEWLIAWNSGLTFPEALAPLDKLLRDWENSSNAIAESLLKADNWWAVCIGTLVIGILTGFSEEIFFRGGLQGLFMHTAMGKKAAVWLAAFIFSTLHFQFFGFFPRLLMGAFFGYLLYWTGSLWVPVFAHTLNNGMIVILSGIFGHVSIIPDTGLENADEFFIPLGSLILSIIFFLYFRQFFFETGKRNLNHGKKEQYNRI